MLRGVQNLCYSDHIAYRSIDVSFGVPCSNIHTANYELLITMHLDNCCENQSGVARQDCLY